MKHGKQMLQHYQNNSENISNHFMQHQIALGETSQITSCNIKCHQMKHLKTLHATSGNRNRNISKRLIHTPGREQQVVWSPEARTRGSGVHPRWRNHPRRARRGRLAAGCGGAGSPALQRRGEREPKRVRGSRIWGPGSRSSDR
jgi:hypothetical protein